MPLFVVGFGVGELPEEVLLLVVGIVPITPVATAGRGAGRPEAVRPRPGASRGPAIWKLVRYLGLFCRRPLRADVIIAGGFGANKGRKVYF